MARLAYPWTPSCAARTLQRFARLRLRLKVVILDTETTSLRGQVIQVAAVGLDASLSRLFEYKQYWRTSALIDPQAHAVHGITQEMLQTRGQSPSMGLRKLQSLCGPSVVVAAHNVTFDVARLQATAAAYDTTFDVPGGTFCTMRSAKGACNLKTAHNRVKFPRNEELYHFLFPTGAALRGLHDALVDVRVTAANFVEGTRRQIWNPPFPRALQPPALVVKAGADEEEDALQKNDAGENVEAPLPLQDFLDDESGVKRRKVNQS